MSDLRFGVGDRVEVSFTDLEGAPRPELDLAHQGQAAEVIEVVTRAWKDGYKIRFADGYETYAYDHETEREVRSV